MISEHYITQAMIFHESKITVTKHQGLKSQFNTLTKLKNATSLHAHTHKKEYDGKIWIVPEHENNDTIIVYALKEMEGVKHKVYLLV